MSIVSKYEKKPNLYFSIKHFRKYVSFIILWLCQKFIHFNLDNEQKHKYINKVFSFLVMVYAMLNKERLDTFLKRNHFRNDDSERNLKN